jgi:uncharacterized protein (DUF362 family)
MKIVNEVVKNVGVKVVVSDETGQQERDMSGTWLKRLGLTDILNEIEVAIGEIE